MKVSAFIQNNPTPNQKPSVNKPSQDPAPQAPQENYTPSEGPSTLKALAPVFIGAAVGAGVGLFAGAGGGGFLGGTAGALAGTGLGVAATVGAARVGLDEQSFGIGMAGVAIGGIGGCILGAMGHSWASGAALAAGGALAGGLVGISSLLK
ncbi:MAG: hypothetical protein J0I12_03050 [Candidatus Eremiobacteraeota bacterium]|nr:hypothetical protein [Candidatus Eremiobacteraeota bacterium]